MHPRFNEFFKITEFDSPDLPNSGNSMDKDFLYKLVEARIVANMPFKINSGFRTAERNAKVGGVIDSSHTLGLAADIAVLNSNERYIILQALMKAGFNRFGIGRNFIHVDSDTNKPSNCIWHYYDK